MHRLRHRHAAEHVDRALVHAGGDRGDVIGPEPFALHQRQQRIGRRVGMAAGGVELERGFRQRPARAEPVGQLARLGIAGHARGHALLAFKDVLRAGQAIGGQVGGEQAIGSRLGGVQLLGVRRVTEKLPQPRRLRTGAAEQMGELLLVETHQLANGHCRGQGADRRGGVEDAVMRAAEELADADARLVAGHRGHQQLSAGLAEILRRRQRSGKHDRGRVQHGAVVQVVLLHQVRTGGIHQRGEIGRAALAVDQNARRPVGRAHLLRVTLEQRNRMRAGAGQGRAEPVEKEVFGAGEHRFGDLLVGKPG